MLNSFFNFFNQERPFIPADSSKWPPEWEIVRWKSYPRYPRIYLPTPELGGTSFKEVILNRKSERDFSKKFLTLQELSNLLFYSCGLIKPNENLNLSRRPHPSGGGLYSIEMYAVIFEGYEAVSHGLYHYNILEHCLEKLPDENIEPLKSAFYYPWVAKASMVLLFSFIEGRLKPKYGNLAYKIALLEAGHIGQNIYLNSAALGLKCCALGALKEDIIHKTLDLDGISETVFYAIAVGK